MTHVPPDDRLPVPLDELVERFGSAKHPERPPLRARPDGLDDSSVAALGKLSAALEDAEDARGHLYAFHRLSGRADLDLQDAVAALRDAGHADLAEAVDEVLVGRDVIAGRWTFQLVEDYDAGYLEVFRQVTRSAHATLGIDAPHLFEAELKADEQRG